MIVPALGRRVLMKGRSTVGIRARSACKQRWLRAPDLNLQRGKRQELRWAGPLLMI